MTAEVGILTQRGLALAADSAVTFNLPNGERNTLNDANKLFTLYDSHYIGIMIYNNANFMGIPWELIINSFKERLGNEVKKTVRDYVECFKKYMASLKIYRDVFEKIMVTNYAKILANTLSNINSDDPKEFSDVEEQIGNLEARFESESLVKINLEDFSSKYGKLIQQVFESKYGAYLQELAPKLIKLVYAYICSSEMNFDTLSGVVFAGYGAEELFPTLIQLEFDGRFFGKNKVKEVRKDNVDPISGNVGNAVVVPLAQDDMIQTILLGIDPQLQEIRQKGLYGVANQLVKDAASYMPNQEAYNDYRQKAEDAVERYDNYFENKVNEIVTSPFLSMLGAFSIDDIGNMARTLVSLTSFKRKYSGNIRNVGGPIDVLVISRGDGPVWLSNKKMRTNNTETF